MFDGKWNGISMLKYECGTNYEQMRMKNFHPSLKLNWFRYFLSNTLVELIINGTRWACPYILYVKYDLFDISQR